MSRYEPRPRYPVHGGQLDRGFAALAAEIAQRRPAVVAVDGPSTIDWPAFARRLAGELANAGVTVLIEDTSRFLVDRDDLERRTLDGPLRDDPVFAPMFAGELDELFAARPVATPATEGHDSAGTTLLTGPGAALAEHDLLWVVDHPKRVAAALARQGSAAPLGAEAGVRDAERRLMFVDWPVLDRHRRSLVGSLDRFVDLSDPELPRSLSGSALRASLDDLAAGPFRTLPTYAPGPWGGQWLRNTLGVEAQGPNLAWSYELIAPESSVLLGDEPAFEVGFEMVLGQAGRALLGPAVDDRFGGGFPVRFDYLDTMDGGHLSVHCHPREQYMRDVFGWRYTQHESYYVMAASPGSQIFLGLRDGVRLDEFADAAARSLAEASPLDIERFVQTHPAEPHRLYLIPGGTPHASSAGNVVLEISATPYLYSLRFYDWLRDDLSGSLRPVQLQHAFANLEVGRSGERVRSELLPEPRSIRSGRGYKELELGRHGELFFVVRRLELDAGEVADDDTDARFHVLNLVEGAAVQVETHEGRSHALAYGETIVVPASVGSYRVHADAGARCRLVKAFVDPLEG
jgi:mannose-6-phosphate isomerase class I